MSNDQLPGVEIPVQLVSPVLKKIPVLNELLFNFKMIRNLKKSSGYDFIYQRYSGESFCGAFVAKKKNKPFVLEFNSSEVWKLQNWSKVSNPIKNFVKQYLQLPVVKRIEKYNLETADLIVVVSETLKENLIKEGVPETKILVNPNGVEVDKFNAEHVFNQRKKLNLDPYFVFGFIGTFGKWHGVLELANSINRFFENHPELKVKIRFLIIGDGKLFPEFETIITKGGYSEQVICTGQVEQSQGPSLLLSCDSFLSPHIKNPDGTKFFGSPTKLFEYMACGKPIIASDLDQIGDILEHNKTAWLVEPGNIEELAEAMFSLYKDSDLQTKMGNNARAEVEKNYSWDAHVSRILSKVKEII